MVGLIRELGTPRVPPRCLATESAGTRRRRTCEWATATVVEAIRQRASAAIVEAGEEKRDVGIERRRHNVLCGSPHGTDRVCSVTNSAVRRSEVSRLGGAQSVRQAPEGRTAGKSTLNGNGLPRKELDTNRPWTGCQRHLDVGPRLSRPGAIVPLASADVSGVQKKRRKGWQLEGRLEGPRIVPGMCPSRKLVPVAEFESARVRQNFGAGH